MTDAKAGKFGVVVVESLDRISRDQADLAMVFKKLKFHDIAIRTVNEGETTDIHVGLRGMFGAMFLKDLAAKVKRGHNGRVLEGKFPGSLTYGYDKVLGKPGERVINQEQATVVRRIFKEYAEGQTPREIALGLMHDGIPSPTGGKNWNHQTFAGGGKDGLLGNRLYVGELIWNKHHTVRDPETGRKTRRESLEGERLTVSIPHLRIVDDELWNAAQAVRMNRSSLRFGPSGKITRSRPVLPRNRHLLSGLLRCAECNANMIVRSSKRDRTFVICSAAHQSADCSHRKIYDIDVLRETVLDGMHSRLTDPKAITEAARAFHAEYAAQEKKNQAERVAVEKQRDRLMAQIDRLVAAISDSDEPLPALLAALKTKEAERVGLEEVLRLLGAGNVVSLHPKVIKDYQENVEKLHRSLALNPDDAESRVAFRSIIDSVLVHPTPKGAPYDVGVYGRLASILGVDIFPTLRSNDEMYSGKGALSGISRQNANQCLKRLEREGLLRLEYGGVTIVDLERLRSYGD
jgi:site-specific DNA recombinase